MVFSAPRFIALRSTDENHRVVDVCGLSLDEPLGASGCSPTLADGGQLYHHLGSGEQVRHRSKRFTSEVQVETSHNHPLAFVREL